MHEKDRNLGRNLKARDHLEDLGKEERIIINFIFINWGPVAGSCEQGNEPLGSITYCRF
jgi:hypothetical protein